MNASQTAPAFPPISTTLIAVEPAPLLSPFDDPECSYPSMPNEMHTFRSPSLHGYDQRDVAGGRALLAEVALRLGDGVQGRWDLRGLDAASRSFIGEVLGRGEISVRVDGFPHPERQRLEMEESVFAGLWQIRRYLDDGDLEDYLEIGPLPSAVYQWAELLTQGGALTMPSRFPGGVMNAPAILVEIADKSQNYPLGGASTLNLSLLPMTPQDVALVADVLGLAGLSLVSKGYGDCRIHLTRVPNVWWVQYFNAPGQMILNTLEITAVPQVALAAAEDIGDSAARLRETLAALDA
ncbi:MAG: hydrogenase expression/formation protein [Methylococcaceae bacterium]|nr:MAG: hydrogenase expression/formation protein [Methylococcaceae bacterium]